MVDTPQGDIQVSRYVPESRPSLAVEDVQRCISRSSALQKCFWRFIDN